MLDSFKTIMSEGWKLIRDALRREKEHNRLDCILAVVPRRRRECDLFLVVQPQTCNREIRVRLSNGYTTISALQRATVQASLARE